MAVDALQGFCLGPDGRAAAASELRGLGLPAGPDQVDDLCQQVLVKVWSQIQGRSPDDERGPVDNVVGYARRCLRTSAVDLLRSGRRERLDSLVSGGVDGEDATDHFDPSNDLDDHTPVPWIDSTGDDAIAPLVRWVLQLHLVDRPTRDAWVTSAGLVLSHLSDHPELALAPEIPVPAPRSRAAHHGPRWAALAYAGRLDCFEDPETGAVRQRRSVALRRIERTFADAVHQAAHATDQDMVKAREVER